MIFFPANSNNATASNGDMDITKILKGNTSGVQHANLHANFLTNLSGKLTL